MSEVLVGSAYSTMELRYAQFSQGVSIVEQQIKRLQQLTKTPIVVQAQLAGAGAGSGSLAPPASRVPSSPSSNAQAAEYDRLVRAQAALDAQSARLARTQGDGARAAQLEAQAQERLTSILRAQTSTTTQSIAIERQLTSVQQQSATAAKQRAGSAQQFTDSFKSGLIGIAGPAAAATATIGALIGTADSFKQAFNFKADLDATTASVKSQLDGFRNADATYASAIAFGRRYNITQEETASILQSSIGSLRRSSAGVGELETALIRLQSKDVSKPLSEASRALAELESGDVTSIKELFRVSAKDALAMRDAIAAGGDSVQVLTAYLDRTKTGMDALALRARGARGALNELAVAQEDLKLAQADFAQGPGLVLLQGQINTTRDATKLLQGDVRGLNDILKDTGVGAINPLLGTIQAYNSFVLDAGRNGLIWAGVIKDTSQSAQVQTDIEGLRAQRIAASTAATVTQIDIEDRRVQQLNANAAAASVAAREQTEAINQSAQASVLDTAAKDAQQNVTALLAAQTKQSVDGFFALNPQIDQSGILALLAAGKINAQVGQLALLRLQSDEAAGALGRLNIAQGIAAGAATLVPENRRIGGTGNTVGGIAGSIGGGAGGLSAQQDSRQQALQASRDALALARATTAAQRIAIYQRQLDRQTTEEGRNRILAQIESEKRGGAGRVGAAANTALQLNQVEQNSGLQLLKTQRENLERLRDQAEDFDVRRSRAQEDYAEKRRKLLTSGQRVQAAQLAREFEKDQRRAQEDFDRQNRRTLRNNAEATGDIGARTDLRQQQIGQRAALRGTAVSGQRVPDLGQAAPSLTGTAGAGGGANQLRLIQIVLQARVDMDGKQVGQLVYVAGLRDQIDQDLAVAIAGISAPGSGQPAVAGVG